MDKAVLCIGGSELQRPTLCWAKQSGLRVLLTDTGAAPPTRDLADEFAQIPGDDADSLTAQAIAWSKHYNIVSAYCGGDFGLVSVARIHQTLGLPGLDPVLVLASLNKARANAILRAAGLPVPAGQVLPPDAELDVEKIALPAVVKPVDGSGSRGVTLISKASDLANAVATARSVSPEILIESVVEGHHIDVSGFFAAERFFPGGQLDRYFSPLPNRYPVWGCQPPGVLDKGEQQQVYDLLEQAARALGLAWGPVKADVIWSAQGPVLIEVTPRFHGDVSTSFVCPLAYGTSPVEQWFRWLAGRSLSDADGLKRCISMAGWAGIFPERTGVIRTIEGLDKAEALPGIAGVLVRRRPGSRIAVLSDNRAVIGFVFARGADASEVYAKLQAALTEIRVVIQPSEETES